MARQVGYEAQKPNPALRALEALAGRTLHGRATFEWIEGGAFLLQRSEMSEPEVPSGIAIFGSDDATGELHMLYFDERGVSRKYDVSVEGSVVRSQRSSPDFSQRMVLTVADDGRTMVSKGEMSRDGGAWEPDLELTYTRIE